MPGRGVALEEDLVAAVALVLAAEEVVEAHVVERGGGGEGGDVAAHADAGALRPGDHHGRVPAGRVEDLALDLLVAGEERLVLGGDGVDVVRAAHLGHGHALLARALDQPEHQIAGALTAALVDGGVERVEPLLGLLGIEVRDLAGKAANDDRVAIGSGSHAVPSLSVVLVCGARTPPPIVYRGARRRHLYREVTEVTGTGADSLGPSDGSGQIATLRPSRPRVPEGCPAPIGVPNGEPHKYGELGYAAPAWDRAPA